jgi:hypothetical protein
MPFRRTPQQSKAEPQPQTMKFDEEAPDYLPKPKAAKKSKRRPLPAKEQQKGTGF